MQNNNENENDRDRDQRRIEAQVEELRHNKTSRFLFDSVLDDRWNLLQANQLFRALKASTSVEELGIYPEFCPIPAFPLLLDCIGSNPKFDRIFIAYLDQVFGDNEETREKYRSLIGGIFRAVGQSPSITRLTSYGLGNCPEAVFDMLSKTKTLNFFDFCNVDGDAITPEGARHVAAGFAQNSSLDEVCLRMSVDCLAIAISGIGRSAIKSLSVYLHGPAAKFAAVISNMLPVSPSLKTLVVNNERNDEDTFEDSGLNELFDGLRNPGCGIEELELQQVRLASFDDPMSSSRVNRNLKVLILENVHFSSKNSVRLLHHLVGLKELYVHVPVYGIEADPECWAEVTRRNPGLLKLSVNDSARRNSFAGILSGACGHESLEMLDLAVIVQTTVEAHIGSQFCRLLRETKQLKMFSLLRFKIEREGAELLVEGICQSKNLQHFILKSCNVSFAALTVIVESFAFNQTVKVFDIRECRVDGDDNEKRTFCQTLSCVFGENLSLESFCLPSMEINAENGLMNILVGGLFPNNTIKMIDFSNCTLDDAALTCLEQALVVGNENPCTLSVSSILLPHLSTEDGIKSFLRNLARMPSIKEVTISNSLDAEGKNLLLQAVQEKKTLHSFERGGTNPTNNNTDPVDDEIDFYLKLNRLGRQIVECPTVPASCWPIVLSRMACKQHPDEAALFYFVREYFANRHGTNKPQEQQPRVLGQPPPCKRSRWSE